MNSILMISQDVSSIKKFERILDQFQDCQLSCVSTFEQGLKSLAAEKSQLVIVDYDLHNDDTGLHFLQRTKMLWEDTVRILLLNRNKKFAPEEIINSAEIYRIIYKKWNEDVIKKIIESAIILHTTTNELKKLISLAKSQNVELVALSKLYEEKIVPQTDALVKANEELSSTLFSTVKALIHAVEAKDIVTRGHSDRVAGMCVAYGIKMELPLDEIDGLYMAATLHDVGKIGISEAILTKPDKLTPKEYAIIKEHPVIGYNILNPIPFKYNVAQVALQHHEHFNGKGYPYGISGYDICLGARILNIADTYDAMTCTRPYRKALSKETALQELQHLAGQQFDPDIVSVFVEFLTNENNFVL